MRIRKAFLSCMVVVVVGLLATPAAMATGWYSCRNFDTTIAVVGAGACPVSDPFNPSCSEQGEWTGIQYEVTGSADHVATLVTRNNEVFVETGNQVYPPCVGDPRTGLGKLSCHENAVKINPNALVHRFWVVVSGLKQPIETAMVVRKGHCKKSLAIEGLGREGPNPFQSTQETETVSFKGCSVDFVYDALTGDLLSATLAEGSEDCDFYEADVSALALKLDVDGDEIELGHGQFGEGYVSSGEESCTTRVIRGRVYTWGSPCP